MSNKFSVCTSVYKNDKPEYVKVALDSITTGQSVKPSEVVLVVDGPVPDGLRTTILSYEKDSDVKFKVVWLDVNQGLGNALRVGMAEASNEIVARMDSDDIACCERFAKQVDYLAQHPETDIVGGQITEFDGAPQNIIAKRCVPESDGEIKNEMKSRCPFNHMTVMFHKEAVQNAGGYKDWFWNEDYYLWIRMMQSGCGFANLPDVLVNVRSGVGQYARRGGWKYFKSEAKLQKYMYDNRILGGVTFS